MTGSPTPGQLSGYGGVAVAPHHLASLTAVAVLESGGNAVDAAVAANAVQGVVAPETCGIGGDLFALVHRPGDPAPSALNASGRAGAGADPHALRTAGHSRIPSGDHQAVTIPGCVDGWCALLERFGSSPLQVLLEPAVRYAEEGFTLSGELAGELAARRSVLAARIPELYQTNARAGDRLQRPLLAATLRTVAEGGREAFYDGSPAAAIEAATRGTVTRADLRGFRADWVEPLGLRVFGRTAWTLPPNSQGYLAPATAWIFEELEPPPRPDHVDYVHLMIEAYRAVAWERDDVVADPDYAPYRPAELVDPARLSARLESISRTSTRSWPPEHGSPGDTAYLCVVDGTGMGVSLIQSNFTGLGGGIVAPGTGFLLHNRGIGFDLRPGHPNELGPGKKPLHTLSPTAWTAEGNRLALLLGTRGGHYQPQLLLQAAAHHLYAGASPGETQAQPRWVVDAGSVMVEAGMPVTAGLRSRGHRVVVGHPRESGWGPVSMISVGPQGLRTAAADPRVPTASAALCRPGTITA